MAPAPALVTPAQFSAWTKGKIAANDPRVELLLSGATRGIRRWCGWHIAPEYDDDRHLDGPGGRELSLPTMHLVSIATLTEDGTPLDVDDLEWSELGEIRKPGRARWTSRYRGVHVTFRHGYEDADDVAQVIIQVCANAIASPMGATREQAGALAASWSATAPGVAGGMSLLDRDLALLASYRIRGA